MHNQGVPNQSQVGESTNRRRCRETALRDLFLVRYKWETQSNKALRWWMGNQVITLLLVLPVNIYTIKPHWHLTLVCLLCYTNLTAAMLVTPISKPTQVSTQLCCHMLR